MCVFVHCPHPPAVCQIRETKASKMDQLFDQLSHELDDLSQQVDSLKCVVVTLSAPEDLAAHALAVRSITQALAPLSLRVSREPSLAPEMRQQLSDRVSAIESACSQTRALVRAVSSAVEQQQRLALLVDEQGDDTDEDTKGMCV